jgi:hypothetical protein
MVHIPSIFSSTLKPNAHKSVQAILSHTWAEDEVSFRDMRKARNRVLAQKKAGFIKIQQTCKLALEDGLDYAWVDSCCIDKSSSAELSEAINSMYEWYRASALCYTYLEDMPDTEIDSRDEAIDEFAGCRWFRRGWTLQELLASMDLRFYSRNWKFVGTKEGLVNRISAITGIDKPALQNNAFTRHISVARKMSWASSRSTTRIEDQAYCLMGIFDVHMPLLYGEGSKAFQRLQLEIIKMCSDDSIFAFQNSAGIGGALAHHPDDFRTAGGVSRGIRHLPYSVTNIGLQMRGGLVGGDDKCSGECSIFAAGGVECGHQACYFLLNSKMLQAFNPQAIGFKPEPQLVGIRLQPINVARKIYARHAHARLKSFPQNMASASSRMSEVTIVLSDMVEAKDDFYKPERRWFDD